MATGLQARRNRRAQIRAHTFMFGCGNGGRDFDELDPTEMYNAETQEERENRRFGFAEGADVAVEDMLQAEQKREKKQEKRKRYKANKRSREDAWRKEQQAKW